MDQQPLVMTHQRDIFIVMVNVVGDRIVQHVEDDKSGHGIFVQVDHSYVSIPNVLWTGSDTQMNHVLLYILPQICSGSGSNITFSLQSIIPQDIDEKSIVESLAFIMIALIILLLIIAIFLFIRYRIYRWRRRRKYNALGWKLENLKPFIAVNNVTGKERNIFAMDHIHARRILDKAGGSWTIYSVRRKRR